MRVLFCCLFLLHSTSFAAGEFRRGDKTPDPQGYVLTRAEFPEQGLTYFDCKKCSALKDYVFVAPTSSCGTGGCDYSMFSKVGKEYEYVTTVTLKEGGFEFLKATHNGLPNIKRYWHMSADEGQLDELRYDGSQYDTLGEKKTIKSKDFEKNLKPEMVKSKTTKAKKKR